MRLLLLLLAAGGLLPLVLLLAWGLNHLVDERRAQSERSVLELSRALGTAVEAELRSIAALLEQMGTADELDKTDLQPFYLAAKRSAAQLGWRQVVLADKTGQIILLTGHPFGAAVAATVEPNSMARVLETRGPIVSAVVPTPNFPSDTFAVRVPVFRDGKMVYVLSAVLPVDRIASVLLRQDIPMQSVVSVFDQTNRRIALSRPAASTFPSQSLRALIDSGRSQGVGRTITSEGIENYTGFTRLDGSGWVVTAGRSVQEINRGLLTLLRAMAVGLAASLAVSILVAWVLSRRVLGPIDALKDAAAALGRGEPVQLPKMDIAELNDVAIALTHAAADRNRIGAQVEDALRVAEDANRSKDQFLAMLGHELRNPLAPITTALRLMELKGDASTASERRVIGRQLVHVTRLVDDLLDVSRITGRRLLIQRVPVRLVEVLTQVIDALQPSLEQRKLSLEFAPGVDDAWVLGDEVRLVQIFNNLLVNAVKFTHPGQVIRVRAATMAEQAVVEVEDTGVGISPDQIGRVFDLFYQAPQSLDRARGGLGLGLPIVRSLVEMHGGTVHAASGGSGCGTCMTVALPLCKMPESSRPVELAPTVYGAGRVLVVDDNLDAADTCATLLEMSGYIVRVAYTPESALEMLGHFRPDVAVLDIGLPGMSGYALAGAMRAAPVGYTGSLVALTGYGQAGDKAASHEAGFDVHLTKPVSPEALLEVVGRFSSSADTPS